MNDEPITLAAPAKPMPRPAATRMMKVVRRIHMFAGLFMLPWVLVYGVSALVFNHNSWFHPKKNLRAVQTREVDDLPESVWHSGPIADVGTAESLAVSILKEMNESRTNAQPAWALAGDEEARFTRTLLLESASGGTNLLLQINFSEQSGALTRSVSGSEAPKPRDGAETQRFSPKAARIFNGDWSKEVAQLLGQIGATDAPELKPFRVKNAPELVFTAESSGRRWDVRCNLQNGDVTAREAGQGAGFVSRTAGFLTRLHKTRGYPNNPDVGVRWWWAVLVDATAFLMLFWGISGLAMWWQMRGQRKWGAVAMGACGVATWFIWTGMQSVFR